jgi:hypothetical protein
MIIHPGQIHFGRYVVRMQSATKATLHQGTTKLNVKKTRVGSTEDCYAFVPYEFPDGDAELNVMEVHGIAVLRWDSDDVDVLVDHGALEAIHDYEGDHPGDEDAENAILGAHALLRSQCLLPISDVDADLVHSNVTLAMPSEV